MDEGIGLINSRKIGILMTTFIDHRRDIIKLLHIGNLAVVVEPKQFSPAGPVTGEGAHPGLTC